VQNVLSSWFDYFYDNLTYFTGVLAHQTFLTIAIDTLQQQVLAASTDLFIALLRE